MQALADFCGGAFHRIRGEALLARSTYRLGAIREVEQAILEARSPKEGQRANSPDSRFQSPIGQVIMNLAVNARDAMPNGGSLMISLRQQEVLAGEIPPLPDMTPGNWFELKVSDTGTGIKSHHLPHLFEPFFTTKREGEGTGLGLAQVYGIVKQHNGYIDVSSRPNRGTTFYIYLPRVLMPKMMDSSPEGLPLPEGRGQIVLVVEDDTSARTALAEVLEMMGYEVMVARDGQEALDIFDRKDGRVDLVLSDIVMPKMGGAVLYEELRKRRPDIKMVMMTGYPKDEQDWSLLEDGQVFWVQKPFQVSTITEAIKRALLEETKREQ